MQRLLDIVVASLTCSDAERVEVRDIVSKLQDSVNDPALQNNLTFRMMLLRPALLTELHRKNIMMADALERARIAQDQAAAAEAEIAQLMHALSLA